jgi:hypothetical protein
VLTPILGNGHNSFLTCTRVLVLASIRQVPTDYSVHPGRSWRGRAFRSGQIDNRVAAGCLVPEQRLDAVPVNAKYTSHLRVRNYSDRFKEFCPVFAAVAASVRQLSLTPLPPSETPLPPSLLAASIHPSRRISTPEHHLRGAALFPETP